MPLPSLENLSTARHFLHVAVEDLLLARFLPTGNQLLYTNALAHIKTAVEALGYQLVMIEKPGGNHE